MKPVSIILGALAVLSSAAPTKEATPVETRNIGGLAGAAFDLNQFNNFGFANQDFLYLGGLNAINFQAIHGLILNNNFALDAQFAQLFLAQDFQLQQLLQLVQLQVFSQIAATGALNAFDLTGFAFQNFNLGLLGQNLGGFNLGSLINPSLVPQIGQIAGTFPGFVIKKD